MTSRAQTPLVRGRSNSEKLTFQLCCVNKCRTKRSVRRRNKKKQEHRNIAPLRLQLRSYNKMKKEISAIACYLSEIKHENCWTKSNFRQTEFKGQRQSIWQKNDWPNPLVESSKLHQLNITDLTSRTTVKALINCSLLQSGGGGRGLNGTKKFNSGLQITTLEVNIYHY